MADPGEGNMFEVRFVGCGGSKGDRAGWFKERGVVAK